MLNTSREILKSAYLYLAHEKQSKNKIHGERLVCIKCGRSDKTLLKLANGYICKDCYKEQIK